MKTAASDKLAYKQFFDSVILHLIPVIDLLDGVVVHAKQGQRAQYRPIVSQLTASSQPVSIVKAFLNLYPFETLYIADLNAIQQTGGDNQTVIDALHNTFPELNLWLDAGLTSNQTLKHQQSVLGTEYINDIQQYLSYQNQYNHQAVLSLDFLAHGYQGPQALLNNSALWPQQVIAMTLQQVGANQGVNQTILKQLLQQKTHHHIYAAGGIRDKQDLQRLETIGVDGALIATALHQQQITADDLNTRNVHAPNIQKPE